MKKQSIASLRQLFKAGRFTEELVTELRQDERKGIQQLLNQYDRENRKNEERRRKFMEMTKFEKKAYQRGKRYVAGVDEVGRGPLAGPVVAAAVILPENFQLMGLDDSKQLTEEEKNEFYNIIREQAISYSVEMVESTLVDTMNILGATKFAMKQAVQHLDQTPDHVLVDAVQIEGLTQSQETIIKGDERSVSIAAASILAKVERDRLMRELHHAYPAYGFNSNMGYGTKYHIEQLKKHGITPHHRKSFAPVRKVISSS
jgi:ribonuclease HII